MSEAPSHKTQLRLGSLEFTAEGSEESVRAQWEALVSLLGNDQVMALVAVQSTSPTARDRPKLGVREIANGAETEDEGSLESQPPQSTSGVDPELLRRVFVDDARGVSLRLLPRSNAPAPDALVLLLYGYRTLRGQQDVKATELTAVLRASGLRVDRIDRVLGKRSALVTTGGRAKGKVYGLNNQGMNAAEEMLNAMA